MSRFRAAMTAVALTGAGLTAACGQGGLASQFFPRFGLYFNQDEQGADLAYGAANSDDVGLMLQCAKGSREVQLTDVAAARPADRLVLSAGQRKLDLPVRLTADETGESLAEASIPVDSPVLQAFRQGDAMAVKLGRTRYGLKARREEQGAVARFFTACERS